MYEFYYHLVVGGAWEDQIRYIHKRYNSPIVRIGPNEVHVNDPEYYDTIFNFNPLLDKRKYAVDNLQLTPSHAQHKLSRQGLESFFSHGSILSLEGAIRENVEMLCTQLNAAKKSSSVANISLLYGFLEDPEASKPFFAVIFAAFKQMCLRRESTTFEAITALATSLPDFLLPPEFSRTGAFIRVLKEVGNDTQQAAKREVRQGERRTVFTELPKNEKLPASEKTEEKVYHTALLLLTAALETTAHVLETASFHLNMPENSDILRKLKQEITESWPNAEQQGPSWQTLEKLPFLQAVIKESLRLSLGASGRLSRINHYDTMKCKEWKIPAGYEISMTQFDLHFNEDIFPDPWAFRPDRWSGEEGKLREKYLVSFSRGSRACIGMNLALCELNLTLATVVRRFDFKLYETDRRAVDYKYDYFVPLPENDTGVRVEVI